MSQREVQQEIRESQEGGEKTLLECLGNQVADVWRNLDEEKLNTDSTGKLIDLREVDGCVTPFIYYTQIDNYK